ncbi:hypothetical protein ILUMI_13803 [Ignelater luminosus]|uniref:Uncharacterized protein n=1 Tax=Ignelater luminosus TaxID=2038154 RepID=A0A8K0CRP5_IGNLU|nr:hypothetical protein ILUMI_13803 [Ignelater luminosus]
MLFATFIISVSMQIFTVLVVAKKPSYFPTCYRNDPEPELSTCLLNGFKILKPYLHNGIPEIGLLPLNPLLLSKVEISQSMSYANYSVIVDNFTVWGFNNYNIKEFKYNPHTMNFHGEIEYDKLIITAGAYNISGQIILIPLEGTGHAEGILGPLSGIFNIDGNITKKNGVDYYNTTNVQVYLHIVDGSYFLSSLFDNNIPKTRATNELLNVNSKLLTEVITPMFEELAKLGIRNLMASLTDAIPYNQMFPLEK